MILGYRSITETRGSTRSTARREAILVNRPNGYGGEGVTDPSATGARLQGSAHYRAFQNDSETAPSTAVLLR